MNKKDAFKCIKPNGYYMVGWIIADNPLCKLLPDYFAPYLFTTEDGVDIYKGDWTASILMDRPSYAYYQQERMPADPTVKFFSTKEAAQAYIDKHNEPKFKVGKWYYITYTTQHCYGIDYSAPKSTLYLVFAERYDLNETRIIFKNINGNEIMFAINDKIDFLKRKATHSEIESALIAEAKRRGFKEGVKINREIFKNVDSYKIHHSNATISNPDNVSYFIEEDILMLNNHGVYCKGQWAEIIEEPKEETWNDIIKYWKDNCNIQCLLLDYLKDTYHPPKRKSM